MAGLPPLRPDGRSGEGLTFTGEANIRVLLRPDCHLCHLAIQRIEVVLGPDSPFTVERVDIDSDPDLLKRNLERIPVVEVDGVEVSELEFDEEAFTTAIGGTPGPPGQ